MNNHFNNSNNNKNPNKNNNKHRNNNDDFNKNLDKLKSSCLINILVHVCDGAIGNSLDMFAGHAFSFPCFKILHYHVV